jgi:REP element-mobilizing transposase RayT
MPRSPRCTLDDYRFFHAYCRGVDGALLFRDDVDRVNWVSLLARTVDHFRWQLWTYCLMTNHLHLVVETNLDGLSRGMHRLNGTYAQRFNRRHERTGHLFQNRFSVRAIDSERQLLATCAYVLDNPVRAGVCDGAREWPWSGAAW